MLLFLLLSTATAQLPCRPLVCNEPIDAGLCMILNSTTIRAQPCRGDRNCDYVTMLQPILGEENAIVECSPNYQMEHKVTFQGLLANMSNACGNYSLYKNSSTLVNQSVLLSCTEDTDCQLSDGSYTACNCGLDGNKYCVYGLGDDAFLNYSQAACDGRKNDYLAYTNLIYFQSALLTYPACAGPIFADFSWIEYLKEGGDAIRLFDTKAFAQTLVPALALMAYL